MKVVARLRLPVSFHTYSYAVPSLPSPRDSQVHFNQPRFHCNTMSPVLSRFDRYHPEQRFMGWFQVFPVGSGGCWVWAVHSLSKHSTSASVLVKTSKLCWYQCENWSDQKYADISAQFVAIFAFVAALVFCYR